MGHYICKKIGSAVGWKESLNNLMQELVKCGLGFTETVYSLLTSSVKNGKATACLILNIKLEDLYVWDCWRNGT
jgi:hypothetical protein